MLDSSVTYSQGYLFQNSTHYQTDAWKKTIIDAIETDNVQRTRNHLLQDRVIYWIHLQVGGLEKCPILATHP